VQAVPHSDLKASAVSVEDEQLSHEEPKTSHIEAELLAGIGWITDDDVESASAASMEEVRSSQDGPKTTIVRPGLHWQRSGKFTRISCMTEDADDLDACFVSTDVCNKQYMRRSAVESNPKLTDSSRALRRAHFHDVRRSVAPDGHGFMSVEGLMSPRGQKCSPVEPHVIEAFQHSEIEGNSSQMVQIMQNEGILCQFVRHHNLGWVWTSDLQAEPQYLGHGISDGEFNEVFTTPWGVEMRRRQPWSGQRGSEAGPER